MGVCVIGAGIGITAGIYEYHTKNVVDICQHPDEKAWIADAATLPDYSKYLTDTGFIKDIDVNQYLQTLDVSEIILKMDKVEDSTVGDRIESILESYKTLEEDSSLLVEQGDQIQIDFSGTINGETIQNGSGSDYTLTIGSGEFPDEFETQLIGHHVGEYTKVDMTFPEDYKQTELAGREAIFSVHIDGIYKVPTLTDEFVKNNYSDLGLATINELKDAIRQDIVRVQEGKSLDEWIDASIALSSYPEEYLAHIKGLLERQYESQYEQLKEIYKSYNMDFEYNSYQEYYSKNEEKFEEVLDTNACAQVKRLIAYQKILQDANLSITDTDYNYFMAESGISEEDIEQYGKPYIMQQVIRNKVIDYVSKHAQILEIQEGELETYTETNPDTASEEAIPEGIDVEISEISEGEN